jgi:hypothetical protein
MRRLVASLGLMLLPAAGWSQVVDHTKVRQFSGEEVTVEGPVARGILAGGGVIWFSLGKPHPSATLVVVVPAEFVSNFDDPRSYEGATIRAAGRIRTGDATGIGTDPTTRGALRGGAPKTPYLVLEDPSKFRVMSRSVPTPPPAPPPG